MKDNTDNPEVIIPKKQWIKPDFVILDSGNVEGGVTVVNHESSGGLLS